MQLTYRKHFKNVAYIYIYIYTHIYVMSKELYANKPTPNDLKWFDPAI